MWPIPPQTHRGYVNWALNVRKLSPATVRMYISVACRDPVLGRPLYMSDQDLAAMRAKFPFLEAFTDMFIRTTPPESLLKMEATTIKMRDSERGRDADNKLAANRSALAITTKTVPAGPDNRWSHLHEGRFLPGAGCSAAKIWLRAREILGLTGAPPSHGELRYGGGWPGQFCHG